MNILLTLRQPLLPADTGGKVRSLNIFRRLANRVSIHAVSFADRAADGDAVSDMKELFESYTPVFWNERKKHSASFYAEVLASQFGLWPYSLSKCNQPAFVQAVKCLSRRQKFDLMLCDFLHTAAPLLNIQVKPKIVFEHNVEFLLRKRKWEVETSLLRKRVFRSEWRKTRAIENVVCRSFDHVLAVSEDDETVMRREFGVNHISVLPTGVDTDFFRPAERTATLPGRFVFVGSMDWDPNEDGVKWFLREIYPRIRQIVPTASFTIVGRSPSAHLRTLVAAEPNVVLTGTVKDVRPYLEEAEIVVVPLRVGGGTRIKIPEAMAMAKPVLSTTIGAEGLPFASGREICIADDPGDFAETALTLLRDQPLRKVIGATARRTVVERHGWDTVVGKLEGVLEQVVARAGAAQSANVLRQPVEVNV